MPKFRWIVIPDATSNPGDIPKMVELAGVGEKNYIAVIMYPELVDVSELNLNVSYFFVEGQKVKKIPPTVAEVHLKSIKHIRIIYAPEIYFSPRLVFIAWRNFVHSGEKRRGGNFTITEREFARSIIVPYIGNPGDKDIVFISDHFPHEKHMHVFDVRPYRVFPRDIVFDVEIPDFSPDSPVLSIQQMRDTAERLLRSGGYIVVDAVSHMLDVIFRRLLIEERVVPSLGKFILVGPPGVGKTTFAKRLARVLFGSEEVFERVNLNTLTYRAVLEEYLFSPDKSPFVKLHGYRRGVILWDEADKIREPDAYDLLMQVLEEDSIRLLNGERVHIGSIVHIFTANKFIEEKTLGLIVEQKTEKEQYLESVRKWFANEAFLDRIDGIFYMGPIQNMDGARELIGVMLEDALCECIKTAELLEKARRWVESRVQAHIRKVGYVTPRDIRKFVSEFVVSGM